MYSTFQSHEPEFDYLKSLEIEEKINKIRWLKRKNPAHFLLSTNDKTIKLWKVSERDKKVEGYNTKEENGAIRDPACITSLRVSSFFLCIDINSYIYIVMQMKIIWNEMCIESDTSSKRYCYSIHTGANHKANGIDGRGITKKNICQCAHLSYKQYKCQQ